MGLIILLQITLFYEIIIYIYKNVQQMIDCTLNVYLYLFVMS